MLNVLQNRNVTDFDLQEKENIYLKYGENIKLRINEDDKSFFDITIIENKDIEATTPTQKRIKEAKQYFEEVLNEQNTDTIIQIFDKITSTKLIAIVANRKEATLLYELQNNRGINKNF
ncbi:MAG: hypothetical protein Q4C98_10995 [Capnocytophaga sp.]|nr:hypothetical protein [Capnocytophaga sp.]